MNDSLMFDTPYYLAKEGVDYRTSLLINDLKAAINKQDNRNTLGKRSSGHAGQSGFSY